MSANEAIDMGRDAIITALMIGAPVLVVGMLVGLLIGLAQALTQIQDQTLAFVPKIVAMVLALCAFMPWLLQRMTEYFEQLMMNIPTTFGPG